ncbi:hypothetical protein DB2_53 [Octadecabacter Antarctic DB virus 2]|nr:hypothetical protein DB2_53 [Octadecabacter Antarctic DB virus 2]
MTPEITKLAANTRKIVDVQTSSGNWNYDAYMHGMANGMLLMQGMIEGVEPEFMEAPDEWLSDRDVTPEITSS